MKIKPSGTVWTVLVLGGLMLVISIIKNGRLAEGNLLGVLAYLVLGSLYPPAGILLGAVIVFGMLFRGGMAAISAWLSSLASRSSGPSVTSLPLGPPIQTVDIPAGYNPFPAPVVNVTTRSNV